MTFVKPLRRVWRFVGLAPLVATLGSSSCDFDAPERYRLTVALSDGSWASAFETGDEVTFIAAEGDLDAMEHPPDSRIAPQNYGWASSNTAVATISNGVLVARSIGASTITAQGLHSKTSFQVLVGPRFGRIELTPDSANVAVGETATFRVLAFDPDGQPISVDSSRGYLQLTISPSTLPMPSSGGYDQWAIVGTSPGVRKLVASVDVYRGSRLRDTSILVVR
jgi:hypothetical protein